MTVQRTQPAVHAEDAPVAPRRPLTTLADPTPLIALLRTHLALATPREPLLVHIVGPTCSGKSRLLLAVHYSVPELMFIGDGRATSWLTASEAAARALAPGLLLDGADALMPRDHDLCLAWQRLSSAGGVLCVSTQRESDLDAWLLPIRRPDVVYRLGSNGGGCRCSQ